MKEELYEETISWLYTQFPSYQNQGTSAYKPSLDNIKIILKKLELDVTQLKYIHIAGTNGKGTTASVIASILTEASYKTGLFTSPHIKDFTERMRVDGERIDSQSVVEFVDRVKAMEWKIAPSFFEITWAMAVDFFIKKNCDIVVVETGLGGRLDATNVITPLLSIVTNIGLEHTEYLGNTKAKIAFEKGGIIKENVPVIIGESDSETLPVFEKITQHKKAELIPLESKQEDYFSTNLRVAKKALEVLEKQGFKVSAQNIVDGIEYLGQNTGWKARFQIIATSPKVIVDIAHNLEGIKALLQRMEKLDFKNLHILYGTSSDKDYLAIIKSLPFSASIYLTCFKNARSWKLSDMTKIKQDFTNIHATYKNAQDAYRNILSSANEGDVILICGSFFLIEEFF